MLDERFLDGLAADLRPVRRRRWGRDAALFGGLCLVELLVFLGIGMKRHDMGMAMDVPSFWWKLASLGVLACIGAVTAIGSFDPTRSPQRGLRALLVVVLACLAAGWAVDAASGGVGAVLARLDWRNGLICAADMVGLSLPPLLALALLMRRGAATDLEGTSLAVGVAAAAWGAFVFVFECPNDDPLYLAVWYLVGCGAVTVAARVLLPRLNGW
jgi:hypothetical protein